MKIKIKANEVRTKLVLKSESDVEKFIKSKVLINTMSPLNLYNSYSNIQINIKNTIEYDRIEIKDNQKKLFFDDSNVEKKDEIQLSFMEVFRTINKILISEKKNKTFYDRLSLPLENNNNNKSDSPLNLFNNQEDDKIKFSMQNLRQKAQNLIDIILRKQNYKKCSTLFYLNPHYKSLGNLRTDYKKKIKNKDYLKFENPIIENSPITYSSNINDKKSYGIASSKNRIYKSSNYVYRNIYQNTQIYMISSTCFNFNEKKIKEKEKKNGIIYIGDKINPFKKTKMCSKMT